MINLNLGSLTKKINGIVAQGANSRLTDKEFLEREIDKWKKSSKRKLMITGERYYEGEHDILKRKRTVIGQDGILQEVDNLPNNKIVDNQYAKMVDQKANSMGCPHARSAVSQKNYAALSFPSPRFQIYARNWIRL
jgi:hypothetical protein